jgi:hypothetical protein
VTTCGGCARPRLPLAGAALSGTRPGSPFLLLLRHPIRQRGLSQFNCLRQARISGAEPEVAFRPTQRDQSYRPATCLPAACEYSAHTVIWASRGRSSVIGSIDFCDLARRPGAGRAARCAGDRQLRLQERAPPPQPGQRCHACRGHVEEGRLRRCRYQARSERATARLVRADMRWRREYLGAR